MSGKTMTLDAVDGLFELYGVAYDPIRLAGGRLPLLLRFRRYLEEAGLTEPAAAESAAWCRQRERLALAYWESIKSLGDGLSETGCGDSASGSDRAGLFRSACGACLSKGGCGE